MTDVSAQPVAGSNPSQVNSNATIIGSENEIIAKLKEMFEKETSLDICVDMKNPLSSINLQLLKSLIITACAAGKKIRLVTEIDIHNIDYCKSILQPNIELRHLYDIAGLMILGRTRFVSSVAFEELAAARQLIVSNSADIISHQSRIFRELWEIAIPVKIRISGIENGDQVGKTELVQNPLSAEEIYTNAFHGAQQSILLMLPTVNAFERFRKMGLMDLIKEKGLKGVKVRVLLPANEIVKKEIQNEVSKSKNVKLHFISTSLDKKATIILIIDNRFSMAIEIKDDTNEVFTKTIGFATISTVGSTVHSYKSLFDSYWMHTESYEKLLYAERLKDEFINIAAHELRTPIMPIVGIVEVLMSKVNEEAYSSLRDDIEIIYRNADRLKMLAEDILNVSRIESGNFKLEVSDVDLNSIIAESIIEIRGSYMYWSREQRIRKGSAMSTRGKIVSEYTQNNSLHSMIMNIIGSAAAAEKAILDDAIISFSPVKNIDSNDSICQTSEKNKVDIRCDSKRIKQVVYNLLANALKFSDLNSSSGGKIFVSIVSVGHDRIRIRVKDRGTGIDPSIMDKMFERFTTKSDSGIGLGLYISRRIVETHGGAIGAENNIDGPGATF